ncbi:hypothetical protein LR48_Vigan04g143300 [Vigna angularis]|uniref:Transposase (putative) gypsy type domain-containing protein n=1 Tax=Phaseolus angularis TaxID=3914 RepID=A0A0L9UE72_PHAAN|nr:hypothetical protein LR48_Vigan04g143300 [Vigna angularis]
MAVVHVESSLELSGRSGKRSMDGGGERGSSPSSVSSSFLEEFARSSGTKPNSPADADKRIIFGIPIHLLKGGIPVDDAPLEPNGDGTIIPGYDWVPHDVSLFASEYGTKKALTWRIGRLYIVRDVEDSRLVQAGVSLRNEQVYHGKGSSPDDFFFMYANFFDQLCIRVPFTRFQMVVLREMNVAPAQLHPNSWAVFQVFLAMCLAIGITPTIPILFHYFDVRPLSKGVWVSLTSVKDRTLFRPFFDSYKNFKNQFFKVIIDEAGRHEFHDVEGNPLFPFYWTRNPRKIKAYPVDTMNLVDLEAICTINALPRRLSTRNLVECLRHEDCERKAFGMRKDHKEGERSASKKGRKEKEGSSSRNASKKGRKVKEGSSSRPLPNGVFSSEFNISDQTNFHMSLTHRSLIEGLSEPELTNAMLEMSTWATSLAWYLREFADRRGAENVRTELLVEKKTFEDLRATMEQMLIAQDESNKKNDELQAELDKAKEDLAEASDRLRDA